MNDRSPLKFTPNKYTIKWLIVVTKSDEKVFKL
jgi:hypothetical protein